MSRIDTIKARLRELERELESLERFGRDRFEVGDVIRFKRDFRNYKTTKTYTYAALKTPHGWYVTGKSVSSMSSNVYTYDELIAFIAEAYDVEVATGWVDVTDAANEAIEN